MKHRLKLIARSGGNVVMLGLFWTGAVFVGGSIVINYIVNKEKFNEKNNNSSQYLNNLA